MVAAREEVKVAAGFVGSERRVDDVVGGGDVLAAPRHVVRRDDEDDGRPVLVGEVLHRDGEVLRRRRRVAGVALRRAEHVAPSNVHADELRARFGGAGFRAGFRARVALRAAQEPVDRVAARPERELGAHVAAHMVEVVPRLEEPEHLDVRHEVEVERARVELR